MNDIEALRASLARAEQEHLLTFYERLLPTEQARLVEQIRSLDLDELPRLVKTYVRAAAPYRLPPRIEPAYVHKRQGEGWDIDAARARGERLLREGKAAAFTVAGGQGSRLGFNGPKGCFPTGAVTRKPLFRFFAEALAATGKKYGRSVPWAIMTSPQNHEATILCFRENEFFGLDENDVRFFPQGDMPSFDLRTGRILLAGPGTLATNPDGHGGSIKALKVSGVLDEFRARGVEHLSYFQVDNPIVRVMDPVFLGLHAGGEGSSGEMSSKMVPKAYPGEKLGVFCRVEGRTCVIEYSDLPREVQEERLPDGRLRFGAGSVAIHAMSLEFVARLASDPAFSLPYHRAEKKVACVDLATGERVEPSEPNAVKLERFVFDALPMCEASIVYETDRVEEFAPIKNAEGVDSHESSVQVQTLRAARWLEQAGVKVARKPDGTPDCVIELSPLTALEPGDLAGRDLPVEVKSGDRVVL